MEEIRLWKSGSGKGLRSVEAIPGLETEVALEDLLVAHPELLEDGLTLVGRQTPTVGGWLDLLGVDRGGRLVIFELKRGALGRDAVTQVLDYASAISAMEVEALVEHIDARSADGGMDRLPDFRAWYEETFDDLQRLFPVRMALVGLGVDETALRIARFLEEGGRPIEVIIFHGFRDGESTLLARQMPIPPSVPVGPTQTIADRREQLTRRLEGWGLRNRFETVRDDLLERLPDSVFLDPRTFGISLKLDNIKRSGVRGPDHYFGIYVADSDRGQLVVSLGSVLKKRHADDYRRLEEGVRGLKGGGRWVNWLRGKGISVDSDGDWTTVKPLLCEFVATVSREWERYRNTPPE